MTSGGQESYPVRAMPHNAIGSVLRLYKENNIIISGVNYNDVYDLK